MNGNEYGLLCCTAPFAFTLQAVPANLRVLLPYVPANVEIAPLLEFHPWREVETAPGHEERFTIIGFLANLTGREYRYIGFEHMPTVADIIDVAGEDTFLDVRDLIESTDPVVIHTLGNAIYAIIGPVPGKPLFEVNRMTEILRWKRDETAEQARRWAREVFVSSVRRRMERESVNLSST